MQQRSGSNGSSFRSLSFQSVSSGTEIIELAPIHRYPRHISWCASWFVLVVLMIVGCSGEDFALSPDLEWPVRDRVRPAALSSTFGPRIQGSTEDYDFHRGLDIPLPRGTPVYPATPGKVVIAGDDPAYPPDSVQLMHCSEFIEPAALDQCPSPFFTLYSHLSEIRVEKGQLIDRRLALGLSGASDSGFEHLHFEIREGGSRQADAVHPLGYLPHADTSPATVRIDEVIFDDPAVPIVHGVVTRPATELDFVRMDVEVYSAVDNRLMSSQGYDVNEWNREFTPEDDPTVKLDDPFFNGVTVRPKPFGVGIDTYEVLFRFRRLASDVAPAQVRVVVRTLDVDGNADSAECSPCL